MGSSASRFTAEAIGTFALVFIGAGAVIVESHTGPSHLDITNGRVGLIGIALAHGLTVTAMIYAVGSISGAHFNPAVSFAAWLQQKIDANLLAGYLIAQIGAAIAASLCLAALFPDEVSLAGLGTPALAPHIQPIKGIAFEALITFLFVTVILLCTRKEGGAGPLAGLAIGAALGALILFAGPLTGAAANPARYLGPALISGRMSEAIVYLVGPMVGSGAAAFLTGFMARSQPLGEPDEPLVEPGPDPEDAPAAGGSFALTFFSRGAPKPRGTRVSRGGRDSDLGAPDARLRRAYQLFEAGQLDVAASVAKPLLDVPDFSERARALLIVIEGEPA